MLRSSRFGFTLLELIVVIAIIGLLMALLQPATRRIRVRFTEPMSTVQSPSELQNEPVASQPTAGTSSLTNQP